MINPREEAGDRLEGTVREGRFESTAIISKSEQEAEMPPYRRHFI